MRFRGGVLGESILSPSDRSAIVSLKDSDLYGPWLFGRAGIIPSPVWGWVASNSFGMKPAGGYMSARTLGNASFGALSPSLNHVGGAHCAVAVTFKVVALLDLSSMLIFVSPKVSCELNAVNSALGYHWPGGWVSVMAMKSIMDRMSLSS
jgi:hypothetical protein